MVAAVKAGLSQSKTLKKFSMELKYTGAFQAEYILTSISRPLEELELIGFEFRECMLVLCTKCICGCVLPNNNGLVLYVKLP